MEKKIKTQHLFLLLFMFSNISFYSHQLFAQGLQPLEPKGRLAFDSVKTLVFQDTNQIIEWGKGNYFVQSKELHIKQHHIFILMIDVCSGISCPFIYVFKEKKEQWIFVTGLSLRSLGLTNIKVDDNEEKIIFEEVRSQIVTDITNIEDKGIYEIKMVQGEKRIFEKIYKKIAEIPFESFLDSD
jgi:hypothetical protein